MVSVTRARTRRVAAVPLALLLGMVAAAPTVASGTPGGDPEDYGAFGTCMYRSDASAGEFQYRLTRIVVSPPTKLYANKPGQMVGWRFKIQQAPMAGLGYQRIFAGKIHTSAATPNQAGIFSSKAAHIPWADPIPNFSQMGPFYRAVARFYWYRFDESIQSVEHHLLSPYISYVDGVKTRWWTYGGCYELWPKIPI
jgi:hypothetical protein